MKTALVVVASIALALVLVAAGLWLGATWAQGRAATDLTGWGPLGRWSRGLGMMGGAVADLPCAGAGYGPGMMGLASGAGVCGGAYPAPASGEAISLDQAQAAAASYLARIGYGDLELTEVMEFERNFYAIAQEKDTGIGAMELVIDKVSGVAGPEMGPNMMWNVKYGMRRQGMMGGMARYALSGEMSLSPEEAERAAQRWLDANLPGRQAGDADAFYGYYTFHFLKDGQIEGMLSVHGRSGAVWYHSWHGAFIRMVEGSES